MNVQELFAKVNREELAKELEGYCNAELLEDMLDEFKDTEPFISDRVLTDPETVTNTKLGFTAPVYLADRSDILGTEICEKCFETNTETELAASIFKDMTYYGFDKSEHDEEISKELDGASLAI